MSQAKPVHKIKTHFVFNKYFSENRNNNEIMWNNVVELDRPQMIIKYGASALRAV